MTLIRWNPARTRTVDTFQNEVDRLFQSVLAPSSAQPLSLSTACAQSHQAFQNPQQAAVGHTQNPR